MWVTFGQSSGPLPPLDTGLLARKGSLFATRPILFDYIAERRELLEAARELFDLVAAGVIAVPVRQTFALERAREAHAALEGRATAGASVLIP
jgi:NADPH2:quinone reductase